MKSGEASSSPAGDVPTGELSLADSGEAGVVDPGHEALWTRLFADWLEEQGRLVVAELERDGGP